MGIDDLVRSPGVLPTDPGRNRVLIVEDDVAQRMLTLRLLRKAGYDCMTATATDEARTLLQQEAIGVVVTDLRMFAEDGIELVRHVKDVHPEVFSIVLTGFAETDLAQRLERAGAFGLLTKPLEPDALIAMVEQAFEHREKAVALRRHTSS
jgi:DNA-binding NtrC family response regulator